MIPAVPPWFRKNDLQKRPTNDDNTVLPALVPGRPRVAVGAYPGARITAGEPGFPTGGQRPRWGRGSGGISTLLAAPGSHLPRARCEGTFLQKGAYTPFPAPSEPPGKADLSPSPPFLRGALIMRHFGHSSRAPIFCRIPISCEVQNRSYFPLISRSPDRARDHRRNEKWMQRRQSRRCIHLFPFPRPWARSGLSTACRDGYG